MKTIIKYKYTILATVTALLFYIFVTVTNTDIIKPFVSILQQFEGFGIYEIAITGFVISIGIIADLISNKVERDHELKINEQRLHILKATTRTMQDIVNNLVIALQHLRMNAEDAEPLDKESLEMIDSLIKKTTDKINTLGSLESTPEKEIYSGLSIIDYETESGRKKRTREFGR